MSKSAKPYDLAPFVAYLNDAGKSPITVRMYRGFVAAYVAARPKKVDDPATMATWLREAVKGRSTGSRSPRVAAMLQWCAFRGIEPPVRPVVEAAPTVERDGLTPDDLANYQEAITLCRSPAIRCILALLPLTGMALDDLCVLCQADYVRKAGIPGFRARGGFVTLSESAVAALDRYVAFLEAGEWLFPNPIDAIAPVPSDAVREHLREVRRSPTWTPDALRRTFAESVFTG